MCTWTCGGHRSFCFSFPWCTCSLPLVWSHSHSSLSPSSSPPSRSHPLRINKTFKTHSCWSWPRESSSYYRRRWAVSVLHSPSYRTGQWSSLIWKRSHSIHTVFWELSGCLTDRKGRSGTRIDRFHSLLLVFNRQTLLPANAIERSATHGWYYSLLNEWKEEVPASIGLCHSGKERMLLWRSNERGDWSGNMKIKKTEWCGNAKRKERYNKHDDHGSGFCTFSFFFLLHKTIAATTATMTTMTMTMIAMRMNCWLFDWTTLLYSMTDPDCVYSIIRSPLKERPYSSVLFTSFRALPK